MKMTFQPKKRQRSKVHGFRKRRKKRKVNIIKKRIATENRIKFLTARCKKGRKVLSA